MNISNAEQHAVRTVIALGRAYGFGNLISHLKSAWAESLMKDYGFTEEQGQEAAGGDGYPIAMHRDLVDHGKWDETGERYIKEPPHDT